MSPLPEDDPALAQNIGHGEVFGQAKRVPHGYNVESAPKSQLIGLGGQVKAEHKQVRDSFIALRLKMVLRHPEFLKADLLQVRGYVQSPVERLDQLVVRVPPVIGRRPGEADIFVDDMAGIRSGKVADHSVILCMCFD